MFEVELKTFLLDHYFYAFNEFFLFFTKVDEIVGDKSGNKFLSVSLK